MSILEKQGLSRFLHNWFFSRYRFVICNATIDQTDSMRSRYKIKKDFNLYFTTSTIVDWIPLLFNNDLFTIVCDSLKYCQKEKGLRLYGYVILPNHFHLIIGHEHSKEIPCIVRDMKKFTSKAISKYLENLQSYRDLGWLKPYYAGKNNTIWQAGYHPKAIFNETVFNEKIIIYITIRSNLVLWKSRKTRNIPAQGIIF